MREKMLEKVFREIENVKAGKEGKIIWKMNSLVDPQTISALYEASNEGVKIELIIRGICCLVPGVEGLSENIKVRSIVGRFLEHSRVFYFYNDGNEEMYMGSADMMQRNLDGRVETLFPIENEKIRNDVMKTLIKASLKDNQKARTLLHDMTYKMVTPSNGTKLINSQEWLMKQVEKNHGLTVKS
jgi:polyphosphate kinase